MLLSFSGHAADPSVQAVQQEILANTAFELAFQGASGADRSRDLIVVVEAGADQGPPYKRFSRLDGQVDGTVELRGLPPGQYEARLLLGGKELAAVHSFEIRHDDPADRSASRSTVAAQADQQRQAREERVRQRSAENQQSVRAEGSEPAVSAAERNQAPVSRPNPEPEVPTDNPSEPLAVRSLSAADIPRRSLTPDDLQIQGVRHGMTLDEATQILTDRGYARTSTYAFQGEQGDSVLIGTNSDYTGRKIVVNVSNSSPLTTSGPGPSRAKARANNDVQAIEVLDKLLQAYGLSSCEIAEGQDPANQTGPCVWTAGHGQDQQKLEYSHATGAWKVALTGPTATALPPGITQAELDAMPAESLFERGKQLDEQERFGEAAWWYQLASRKGHAESDYHLGHMYITGEGVDQNYQSARQRFLQAGQEGHAASLFNIGYMYANGVGGAVDLAEARSYFEAAARQGRGEVAADAREAVTLIDAAQRAQRGTMDAECDTVVGLSCNAGVDMLGYDIMMNIK